MDKFLSLKNQNVPCSLRRVQPCQAPTKGADSDLKSGGMAVCVDVYMHLQTTGQTTAVYTRLLGFALIETLTVRSLIFAIFAICLD
jgi:hypothetical protein